MNANIAAHVLGIDFGTSKSTMSWFNPRSGQAEIIKNAQGEEKTPSVVYFGPHGVLVGTPAENMLEDEDERLLVFTSVKRFLGSPMKLALPDGRQITPIEMTTAILQKLKQDAETGHFHESINSVVLTCPASFAAQERELLKMAAVEAGFQTVELLEEPVAAALAYGHAGFNCGDNLLVYDLGGGTFDLAVLTRDEGSFRLALEPRGLRCCGGDDFDRAIYDHFDRITQDSLQRTISGSDIYDLQFLRLCRQRKESLSDRDRCEFSTYLPGGVRFKHSLERTHFESLIEANVKETINLTRTVVDDAHESGHAVQTVVLIGGASRVPLVQRLLSTEAKLPVEPQRWQQQDVAVALGAAYYGNSLQSNGKRSLERKQSVSNNLADLHSKLSSEIAAMSSTGDFTVPARTIAKILATEPKDANALQARTKLVQPLLERAKREVAINPDANSQIVQYLSIAKLEVLISDIANAEISLSASARIYESLLKDGKGRWYYQLDYLETIASLHRQIGGIDCEGSMFATARSIIGVLRAQQNKLQDAVAMFANQQSISLAFTILGDSKNATAWLDSAEALVPTLLVPASIQGETFDDQRERSYSKIAKARAVLGDVDGAIASIRKIKDASVTDLAFRDIAILQASIGNFSDAVQTANSIVCDYTQGRTVSEISIVQLKQNDLHGCRTTLKEIRKIYSLHGLLALEFPDMAKKAIEYLLSVLLELCNELPQPLDDESYAFSFWLLLTLTNECLRNTDIRKAKDALETALLMLKKREPIHLYECYIATLCAQVNESQLGRFWFLTARDRANLMPKNPKKWGAFVDLVKYQLAVGDLVEAKEIADAIEDSSEYSPKWEAYRAIASHQSRNGDLGGALSTALSITENFDKKWLAYNSVISAHLQAGDIRKSLQMLETMAPSSGKGTAFKAIFAAGICYGKIAELESEKIWMERSKKGNADVFIHAVECILSCDGDKDFELMPRN